MWSVTWYLYLWCCLRPPPLVGYGLHALVFDWTGSAKTGKIVPQLQQLWNSWINRLSCCVPGDFDIRSLTGFSPCPKGLPLLLLSTMSISCWLHLQYLWILMLLVNDSVVWPAALCSCPSCKLHVRWQLLIILGLPIPVTFGATAQWSIPIWTIRDTKF